MQSAKQNEVHLKIVAPSVSDSYSLIDQLANCPRQEFPADYDYSAQFQHLQNHLNKYYHPNVTAAAAIADGTGFLTDHGPEHIKTVIKRASELLKTSPGNSLSGYEKYILLAASHLHDLGNYFGRESHEMNAEKVMEELGSVLGDEMPEKRAIFEIAQAHGGKIGSDKDKIGQLPATRDVLGKDVHSRFLAALLRLADELADERSRASRYLIESGKIPRSSQVFHKYAYALHSVIVTADAVRLEFELTETDVKQKFGKGKGEVFLLDEIYERTMKMHRERMYCMRFLRRDISIDRIDVLVRIYAAGFSLLKERASISYTLQEAGYPDEKNPTIFALCPILNKHKYGSPLNGAALKKFMSKSK
jgi:hypothetical protein